MDRKKLDPGPSKGGKTPLPTKRKSDKDEKQKISPGVTKVLIPTGGKRMGSNDTSRIDYASSSKANADSKVEEEDGEEDEEEGDDEFEFEIDDGKSQILIDSLVKQGNLGGNFKEDYFTNKYPSFYFGDLNLGLDTQRLQNPKRVLLSYIDCFKTQGFENLSTEQKIHMMQKKYAENDKKGRGRNIVSASKFAQLFNCRKTNFEKVLSVSRILTLLQGSNATFSKLNFTGEDEDLPMDKLSENSSIRGRQAERLFLEHLKEKLKNDLIGIEHQVFKSRTLSNEHFSCMPDAVLLYQSGKISLLEFKIYAEYLQYNAIEDLLRNETPYNLLLTNVILNSDGTAIINPKSQFAAQAVVMMGITGLRSVTFMIANKKFVDKFPLIDDSCYYHIEYSLTEEKFHEQYSRIITRLNSCVLYEIIPNIFNNIITPDGRLHQDCPPVKCTYCSLMGNLFELKIHKRESHLTCQICELHFGRFVTYLKHMEQDHGKKPEKIFPCEDEKCTKKNPPLSFTTPINLRLHKFRYHSLSKCEVCAVSVTDLKHYITHLSTWYKIPTKSFYCRTCDQAFYYGKFQKHLLENESCKTMFESLEDREKKYDCSRMIDNRIFKCSCDAEKYWTKSKLREHAILGNESCRESFNSQFPSEEIKAAEFVTCFLCPNSACSYGVKIQKPEDVDKPAQRKKGNIMVCNSKNTSSHFGRNKDCKDVWEELPGNSRQEKLDSYESTYTVPIFYSDLGRFGRQFNELSQDRQKAVKDFWKAQEDKTREENRTRMKAAFGIK